MRCCVAASQHVLFTARQQRDTRAPAGAVVARKLARGAMARRMAELVSAAVVVVALAVVVVAAAEVSPAVPGDG